MAKLSHRINLGVFLGDNDLCLTNFDQFMEVAPCLKNATLLKCSMLWLTSKMSIPFLYISKIAYDLSRRSLTPAWTYITILQNPDTRMHLYMDISHEHMYICLVNICIKHIIQI